MFRDFPARINFPLLYKTSFIAGYLFVCTLVLIPQIDYKSWYPERIGTFDYKLSQDFNTHKKLTVTVDKEKNISKVLKILYERYKELGIYKIQTEVTEKTISFHLPSSIEDDLIALSLEEGKISLNTRKEEVSSDYSYESLYNMENYEDSGINMSKITDAKILEIGEGYTIIEITTPQQDKWNTIAKENEVSTLGLFVDSKIYLAQISPSNSESPKPKMVIYSAGQDVALIVSKLKGNPLKELTDASLEEVPPIYSLNFQVVLFVLVISAVTIGLTYRSFIKKDSNKNMSQSLLIVIGGIAISKVIPITWGMTEIIVLCTLITAFLTLDLKKLFSLSIATTLMGITIAQSAQNYVYDACKITYVVGIYSLIIYLILFFTGIYEEE